MVASAGRCRSGLAAALATMVVFAMTVRDAGGISVGPPAAEVVSELTVKADVAAKGLMHELAKQGNAKAGENAVAPTGTCGAGRWMDGSSCRKCAAGKIATSGATSCTDCPSGKANLEGQSTCYTSKGAAVRCYRLSETLETPAAHQLPTHRHEAGNAATRASQLPPSTSTSTQVRGARSHRVALPCCSEPPPWCRVQVLWGNVARRRWGQASVRRGCSGSQPRIHLLQQHDQRVPEHHRVWHAHRGRRLESPQGPSSLAQ